MENKNEPIPIALYNCTGMTTYEQVAKDFCAALINEGSPFRSDEKLIIYGFNLADEFFIQLKERQK